jgi:hypothetical protein
MNKQEKAEKISKLSDIKKIRLGQGNLFSLVIIMGSFIYSGTMAGFGMIFLVIHKIPLAIFFGILEYIGIFLIIWIIIRGKKQEEIFLYEN